MKAETLLLLLGVGGVAWWWMTRPELGPAPVVAPGAAGPDPLPANPGPGVPIVADRSTSPANPGGGFAPVPSGPSVTRCQLPCNCPPGVMCACAAVTDGYSIDGGKCKPWREVSSNAGIVAFLRAECARSNGALPAMLNQENGNCEMAVY